MHIIRSLKVKAGWVWLLYYTRLDSYRIWYAEGGTVTICNNFSAAVTIQHVDLLFIEHFSVRLFNFFKVWSAAVLAAAMYFFFLSGGLAPPSQFAVNSRYVPGINVHPIHVKYQFTSDNDIREWTRYVWFVNFEFSLSVNYWFVGYFFSLCACISIDFIYIKSLINCLHLVCSTC